MIKDELSRNQDVLADRQIFLNEKYKPITESQKKVIKTLNDNQTNLQESVNTLSSVLSNKGSTTGVEEWLERQRDYDNFGFDVTNEEDDNLNNTAFEVIDDEADKKDEASGGDEVDKKDEASGGDEVDKNDDKSKYIVPFNIVENQLLEGYNFDPTFKVLPDDKKVRSKYISAVRRMRTNNMTERKAAEFEKNTLYSYLQELRHFKRYKDYEEQLNKDNKTGEGIRKYKQPKRQAYKISRDGMYGGLFINYPKLINEYKVEALKGG